MSLKDGRRQMVSNSMPIKLVVVSDGAGGVRPSSRQEHIIARRVGGLYSEFLIRDMHWLISY